MRTFYRAHTKYGIGYVFIIPVLLFAGGRGGQKLRSVQNVMGSPKMPPAGGIWWTNRDSNCLLIIKKVC